MADITTFYGYKQQFAFYIENNGANPIDVVSIALVNVGVLLPNNIFTEIENTLPITIAGNSLLDIITNQYSLNLNDFTGDATYSISYNVVDMTDFTTVIDTSSMDVTLSVVNGSVLDQSNYGSLSKLNKWFKLGPNGNDVTLTSSMIGATGYPLLQFNSIMEYNLFTLRYRPQFAVFNHTADGFNLVAGDFYFNNDTNTIECYFTEEEKEVVVGLAFNNIILFYSES